jgi:hypothetical protein
VQQANSVWAPRSRAFSNALQMKGYRILTRHQFIIYLDTDGLSRDATLAEKPCLSARARPCTTFDCNNINLQSDPRFWQNEPNRNYFSKMHNDLAIRRVLQAMTERTAHSLQHRFKGSVTTPSWARRLSELSGGSASPRFSRQRRTRAASSGPTSEPPRSIGGRPP